MSSPPDVDARYRALVDVASALTSHAELDDVLLSLRGRLEPLVQFTFLVVTLWDRDTDRMTVRFFEPYEHEANRLVGTSYPSDGTYPGMAVHTGRTVYVPRVSADGPYPSRVLAGYGVESYCVVPLVTARGTLGSLNFGSLTPDAYSPDEREFMTRVASLVAVAVENAMTFETVRTQQRALEELNAQLAREKLYLQDEIRSDHLFEEIIGRGAALSRVLREIETVGPTDSTVLITGETGSGKELVARAIHQVSARRDEAFVKLNCAAIPTGLLESELFGHEKGAFTGAIAQRIGRFELANRGTVFLDEVGEIPLELQPKLLRVLQEREFERLGSARTLRTDARLIAATNRDLAAMTAQQAFRQDLFYRLNVFPIHVPPLRERREDIPTLVRHFAQQFARRMKKTIETIPSETMAALVAYEWPGNIRELQNLIERAVILSPGPALVVPPIATNGRPHRPAPARDAAVETLEDAERRHILAALESSRWVIAGPRGAAAKLGIKRSTLQFRMNKLGIVRPPDLAPASTRAAERR